MQEKERDRLEESIAVMRSKALLDNTTQVGGVQVACAALENIKPDVLKKMADDLKSRKSELIAVMTTVNGDKANLVVACGKDAAAKGAHAGKIAGKIAALTNGKGGGRPDLAMAGVGDKALIDEALSKACDIISEFIK